MIHHAFESCAGNCEAVREAVFYEPDRIDHDSIEALVTARAAGRSNWIVGSGGEQSAQIVEKLHGRGFTGPLWEYLAR